MIYTGTADGVVGGEAQAGKIVYITSIVATGIGVTPGDTVVIKKGGSGGTAEITLTFSAANDVKGIVFPKPIPVQNPYVDITTSGGSCAWMVTT